MKGKVCPLKSRDVIYPINPIGNNNVSQLPCKFSWTDIQAMPDKENVVIIQPVGAVEQHGPHLPIIVDCAIAVAVIGKALSKLDPNVPAYALPPL